jgi:hypothetical protein
VSDENKVQEYKENREEPKDDDVQGHRLIEKAEVVEEPDVEGHMHEMVEHFEDKD